MSMTTHKPENSRSALQPILVVSTNQFGYHIHTRKYSEYLANFYAVTYLCWDYSLPKVKSDTTTVKYVSRQGNKALRYVRFLNAINQELGSNKYDLVFVKYFHGVSLLKMFHSDKLFNVDIRTNSIKQHSYTRYFGDKLLRYECSRFANVTIISSRLAKSLHLKKWHILPLGGDQLSTDEKSFDKIHLLYVGTLHKRNILECVKGLHLYLKQDAANERVDLLFTIIGDAAGNELNEIREFVAKNNLESFVKPLGYVYYNELNKYFERANVGVSYIPMTKYFDNQPPTKTYEYLLSGLAVIATKTGENETILHESCGVLIKDNIESFANGLKRIIARRSEFNSNDIKKRYQDNLWENILEKNLRVYIQNLIAAHRGRIDHHNSKASRRL